MPFPSLRPARRLLWLLLALLAATVALPAAPVKADAAPAVISYEVRGRGNTLDLEEFAAAAAETYADPRGWGEGGADGSGRCARRAAPPSRPSSTPPR